MDKQGGLSFQEQNGNGYDHSMGKILPESPEHFHMQPSFISLGDKITLRVINHCQGIGQAP